MRELYGAEVESQRYEPTPDGMRPLIVVVAKTS